MAFESSLSGHEPLAVKQKVGLNFNKTFRKPTEKFMANKSNNMRTRCIGKPFSLRPCPALKKKCTTCEKVGHFSKIWRSKPQQNLGYYNKQNNFSKEENISPDQASPVLEMRMFYINEQIFSICVTWDYISKDSCNVKMQGNTVADSTVISSKIWTALVIPDLDGKIRHLAAYDSHQLTLLGSLTCDVEWYGSRLTQKN